MAKKNEAVCVVKDIEESLLKVSLKGTRSVALKDFMLSF